MDEIGLLQEAYPAQSFDRGRGREAAREALMAASAAEQHKSARRSGSSWPPRPRWQVWVAAAAAGLAAIGTAAAANGWLIGSPAPPSVQSDFGTFAPQLGFHPDPGSAVLVAQAGDDQLYATTNNEGSYCVIASTPWKRPDTNPDGGTCISKATAHNPIVAGLVAGTANVEVLAGRVSVDHAASISLPLPDGSTRTAPLGTSGFFLTTIEGTPCQSGNWSPQIEALSSDGTRVAASTITLETEENTACVMAGPHS